MALPTRSALAFACPIAFALASVLGCGHDHPPFAAESDGDGGASTRPGGQFDFDASFAPPVCEVATPDGGVCGCKDVTLALDAPTIYFVLDRSGSMNADAKWTTVRTVLSKVIMGLGPRAVFGAAIFPNPLGTDCAAGVEVMPPRRGDAPAGYAGPTALAFASVTGVGAGGGTPTAATFAAITPRLESLGTKVYVILATDGGPNCNDSATCDVTTCITNIESSAPTCKPDTLPNCCDPSSYGPLGCLDTGRTEHAVALLRSAGIPTYVVGVPGSAPYASVLDQLATAGGTARAASPFYYRVDSADEGALLAALSQVAAKIVATCTLTLDAPPADPKLVNVYLDGTAVPQDPVDGWSIDGPTVTLLGATCNLVMSGGALDVRVVAGCPTVGPK